MDRVAKKMLFSCHLYASHDDPESVDSYFF